MQWDNPVGQLWHGRIESKDHTNNKTNTKGYPYALASLLGAAGLMNTRRGVYRSANISVPISHGSRRPAMTTRGEKHEETAFIHPNKNTRKTSTTVALL